MSNSLEVVSPGLLITQVSVQTCVSGCSSQILTISEGNMIAVRRLVALGETEVNDENSILCLVITTY